MDPLLTYNDGHIYTCVIQDYAIIDDVAPPCPMYVVVHVVGVHPQTCDIVDHHLPCDIPDNCDVQDGTSKQLWNAVQTKIMTMMSCKL